MIIISIVLPQRAIAWAETRLPEWAYEGAANPDRWGDLSPTYALCAQGQAQSPIDVGEWVEGDRTPIEFHYAPTPLAIRNDGHTLQVYDQVGQTIRIQGDEYRLIQFHFHTPSEHQRAGQPAPMEVHFVHRNAAGDLAVLGLLVEEGEANPLIQTIWEHSPSVGETHQVAKVQVNAADFLPTDRTYFSYMGSLTTPPCSESVRWYLLEGTMTVSAEQLVAFQRLYPRNARPVRPLNQRVVELHQG
ncbi:MAG: carbonate dehydratase [Leptolyngbya sp. DLM2.Bin15]|nr:MAG: carbonate dehydratase [Leptolyngbya sp. DLM2.Bin15]